MSIPDNATDDQAFAIVNNTANYVLNTFGTTEDMYEQMQEALSALSSTSNATVDEVNTAAAVIVTDIMEVIFTAFGWEVPNSENGLDGSEGNLDDQINNFTNQYLNVFSISFGKSNAQDSCIVCTTLLTYISNLRLFLHRGRCSPYQHWNFHLSIIWPRRPPPSQIHALPQHYLSLRYRHGSRAS
jgi:hypothetical protein